MDSPCKPGLGLKIIKDRVVKLNGKADIISAPEKGTNIKIEIPV